MVLIYSHTTTPRLRYITHFIFSGLLGVDIDITNDAHQFRNYTGVKINYSDTGFEEKTFQVKPAGLLFEEVIRLQDTACFMVNGNKAFFKSNAEDIAFDIFAASFYLVSRYEEYLPHKKDEYGRYGHTNSLAFKENFLHLPLVDIWVSDLSAALKSKFPGFSPRPSGFTFQPTYDIDIAFSYKHKGFIRNAGGFLRSPSLERVAVLAGLQRDPFDSYQWLDELNEQYGLQPIYFFLVAAGNGMYDKNILPYKTIMKGLINRHAKKYRVGLHPSWQSGDDSSLLEQEKKSLEKAAGMVITRSRQHYIRFSLPEGYRRLLNAGIADEYSMGYGSINGFRASTASSFYWYDLLKEEETTLHVHPFCFMEANSFYEQHLTAGQAYDELVHYFTICKKVNGTLITIWHNNFLGTGKSFMGWREMYGQFIAQLRQ